MIETAYRFEPAFLEEAVPQAIAGLANAIAGEGERLSETLPPASASEAANLVAIVDCHYTYLIEGQVTRPIDIERAMKGDEAEPILRGARAHVDARRHVDALHVAGRLERPTDASFVADVHRSLYEPVPEAMRMTTLGERRVPIVPGAFRKGGEEDVAVGRHVPPSSEVMGELMGAYERRFAGADRKGLGILTIPAAHHRLAFIHPFVDGNGRVGRLVSHAMALRAGVGAGGMWSISRGLAQGLAGRGGYKAMMEATDAPRRGDRDGRGNLSQAALVEFTKWFLEACLVEIDSSRSMFGIDSLGDRIEDHLRIRFGDRRHGKLVAKVLSLGEVERGSAQTIVGGSERTARTILRHCEKFGFLKSDTPKGRVRVGFPVREREWLFPGLFADEGLGEARPYERRAAPAKRSPGRGVEDG